MKQKVATMRAQQEEERTSVDNAKQEVKTVKGEFVQLFCKARAVGDVWMSGCVEHALHAFYIEFGEVKGKQGSLWD